jgi:anaerobic magnesium-protoporphyrin IX monomethyl ester cyclase
MTRVLLINPPKEVPLLDWTMRYPPLGLMSIAAMLEGHEVEILDMKAEKLKDKHLAARLRSADIVGVGSLTPSIDAALEICRKAKSQGCVTVLGGVHATLMPQVAASPEVDIVVRGEGEWTFKEIADGRPLDSILGISYVRGTTVVHNPDRPPVDLSTLPPPRRDLVAGNADKYVAFGKRLGAISTTRGCPYRCSFCCVPKIWRGYRELSPREVIGELERLGDVEVVSIVDDNFCHDMRRVEEICDLIIAAGLDDRVYSVFSRVDSVVRHPDVVRKMARANMRVVFIGIEAATQAALDRMNKKTSIGDIYEACEILESNGIFIWAGHIVGNLDDTYEDVEAMIQMSRQLPIGMADFTVITPYPGTDLFEHASKAGLIDEYDFAEYCECEPHMHTTHLSRIEIMELQIKAYMKFYGFRAMMRRGSKWSLNRDYNWLIRKNTSGIRSFMRFRRKSAFYFWRTYKETVGKTEGTRIRRYSPLVSTPVLYSLGAGIAAALVTLLITVWAVRLYGDYASRPRGFVVVDLLWAGFFVAFVVGAVAAWLAVRSYRRGWILSLRRRKPPGRRRSLFTMAMLCGGVCAAVALVLTAVALVVLTVSGHASDMGYGLKEVLVTAVAFLAAGAASYVGIRTVRNGGLAENA